MSNLVVINGINVELEVVDNEVYTTSLIIANVFEKRHDNIIAQIKALPQDEFNALNFKAVEYKDKKGELRPCYNLTRDGFSLLVMGFTGEKAYKWKIEFIKAFNEMEKRLKNLEIEKYDKLAFHQSLGYKSQLEQQKTNFNNEIKALKYDLIQTKEELNLCKGALEVLKRRKDFGNEENLRLLQKELAKYGLVIFNELDFTLWSENLTKNIIGETKRRLDDLTKHNYELLKEKFDKRLKVKN
ncbi:TPA: Rha family transcriptional regulator [Campylobacter jejuni]|nr:Rha family transcriptional regulator [Campylobacter jejuni]HDZ4988081.1 Rha family transcriptional regulator [Campylobacter jejuni]HDZ4994832.1 Rha family transcriptional regulator [Campylobacter jejuni]